MKCYGKVGSEGAFCPNNASFITHWDNVLLLVCTRHAYLHRAQGEWEITRI